MCVSETVYPSVCAHVRMRTSNPLKIEASCAETRFRLSAKRTSPFKSAGGRQFSRLLAQPRFAHQRQ